MSKNIGNISVAFGAALAALLLTVASGVTFVNSTQLARVAVDSPAEIIQLAASR